jgi:spore maturation protein CgeB
MKILCVFGKYQYGKKERGLSTEYFSFVPAMKSLGYEVVFFDSWDRTLYNDFKELNQALIKTVEKEKPDIIFSVQMGYEIWTETWDYINSNFKAKTVNWCTDDSWKYKQHSKFLANHFDLMVTTYEEFLPMYKSQGANAFLSTWAVPIQWIKKPKKAKDCKYKVSFVGTAHGDRKNKIQKLRDAGIEVSCFGYGWEYGAVEADEIPKIFNNSIISLNFANSSGENQIKARVFEVTGSGGFLFTEDAKNLNKFFNKNEIVVYNDMDDCIRKIKYYLEHYEERNIMVQKSFKKTSTKYTYASNIKTIISKLQTISKKESKNIDFEKVVLQHKKSIMLSIIKYILIFIGTLIYKKRGKRFARRLVYELSWRVFKENTYKSKGIVGRMFYRE